MSSASSTVPAVNQDLTDWDFCQDPYPEMARWRRLGPVVYNEFADHYMVTGYRNCSRTLAAVRKFSSQDMEELFVRAFGGVTMEALDSPRHHDMRGIWSEFFQRDSLETQRELVTEIVAAQVDRFVERLRSGETLDAIPNMTRAIPTLVIARMLGIDESMHRRFSEWSEAMGGTQEGSYDPTPEGRAVLRKGAEATAALNAYIADVVIARRKAARGEDLVSMMVFHDYAAEMTEREIIASNSQLVFAGNETTAKLMATTLVALAQYPDQRRALAADRSLIPAAIEEIHRWQTLVQVLPRRACSDESDVDGVRVPRGAEVKVLIGAGNRDPERWERPDEFDIHREPRQHLGFGFGMHVCLGLNLARLELRIWLNQILDKMPDFELADAIVYGRGLGLRGPKSVPLAL
ncbi:cytochrome P450 [Nocardia miyunensis]|uniref:cytochrome P450 n=1 Tax=Nocardia miyunensis TaxID=282684 RepID=UPI000AAC8A34|nr:cytochrome P450 [Nocardia miyunensis]